MIKTIYSLHTRIFPFPSQAGLVLAHMVSMVTKQEAIPLVKALAIIIGDLHRAGRLGEGREGFSATGNP